VRAGFPRRLVLVAWGLVTLTCNPAPPPEAPFPVQAPARSSQPEIRIGLFVGSPLVELASDSDIGVMEGDGMASLSHSSTWSVRVSGGRLELRDGSGSSSTHDGPLTFVPASGSMMSVAGRYYRGSASVFRDRTGLTVVNLVSLEDYLAGVVSAEMGRREPADREALAAQAVISRTYALKNVGKRRSEGFDLYPTVVDQVYGGVWAETQLGWEAVRETAGQTLTFNGSPIDAFFYSTCGGQTAAGTEVFVGPTGPISSRCATRTRTDRRTAGSLPAFAGAKSGPAISSRPSCGEFVQPRFGKYGRSRWSLERARTGWGGSPSAWTKTRSRSMGPQYGRFFTR
jgi:SpoIID/LytB domain